ncbi:small GTP-binding protein [Runella defluvii]|uniref:Small GTP-binding protein n=1 Tax=Runella defluvii TaxID=370973 RepID=A0A7W5ZP02_9BACT|nr:leucine-rich repeat domain-containing protein [Runella defluvii]MBB3839336.1 small GTP-binding protein [Runella defluvii]
MSKLALRLIAENKRTKAPFLDLGNCGLKNQLPEELLDCVWLEKLNLGDFYFDKEIKKWVTTSNRGKKNSFKGNELVVLQKLTALQSLDLSNNQISDYSFLEKLTVLQSLDLSNNQISDIRFLEKFTALQSLDLSINQISDIRFLEKLTVLQSLDLSNNQISDIRFLEKLTALQLLNLSSNQISDIRFLEKLTALQSLYLSNNRISDIRFLEKLTALQSLYLSNNQISDYSFLEKLTALQSLDLSNNQISDYSFLEKLTALQSLDLNFNQINDIRFLKKLTALQSLNLSFNQISDIRFLEKLTALQLLNLNFNQTNDLKSLLPLLNNGLEIDLENEYSWELEGKIGLKDNPIVNPPLEIVKQGREAVIEYFVGKRKPLNECKLIFVGDGGVGKTSLMRRVVFNTFDKNEVTTHGINKIAWEEIENEKGETIRVNLWDFGGQHIQHSLHQFFFTERVIYVLVLNPRNDQKANYWLDQIEKLGRDSEILIAYNCKQEEDKKADFLSNFYELRKKYPKVPEPFLLSCQTGEGIESFKKALTAHILRNEGLNAEYLVKWFNIKQRLEEEVSVGRNYITYETYQKWCNEEEYDDLDRQKNLLKILDSIGSIVFFDKPILEDLQVLNPEWLTTGAYSILVSEQNRVNKGHLSWYDLKEIFKDEKEIFSDKTIRIKYTENQFQFIIELMLQYDLCQRDPFQQNSFLVPSAFGEKPNRDYSFAKQEARSYRLQFDSPFEMLIIHRFIAKNLLKIKGKDYWQSGIYIKHPDSETYALIETNLYSKQIDCWIKGVNIRGFWEVIRADFREILSIYHNFDFKEQVLYQKDGNETFLPYDEMLNSLRNGVRIIPYHPSYQLSNIDVLEVLDLFEDKNQTQRKMGHDGINIKIENKPHFEQKNVNKATVSIKVDVGGLKEFSEIKELLLDLEEYNIENENWKKALIKALDEFNKLEDAEEKSQQKTSISIIDRTFKKLKDLKDVVAIGFLSVDIEKKLPTLLEQWETFKGFFI